MRVFLGIVAACFVGLGIAMIILVIPRLIENSYYSGFQDMVSTWIGALTPGGMTIMFGSVTYMLCSIDARLQDIAESGRSLAPPPRTVDPFAAPASQSSAMGASQGAPDAGDSNHGLF